MDLKKAQGRHVIPVVPESRDNTGDLMHMLDIRDVSEEIQALYAWLNKTIRCTIFEQHRAYLKCPLCPEYDTCAQLKQEQRIELETSPFFSINEITWDGPKRIKTMYIAVCTDGSLRRLVNFDPKNNDGMNLDEFKDIEEVLVVTKAFRRKVIWAPVSLEQVKANQGNGGSMEETENLIREDGNSVPAKQKARKEVAKTKTGKKK
jgi:hypothetical protein